MEIGSVLEELILKCSNIKIRLEDGTEIVVLDSNGNPNIRLKNLVNEGTPTNGARNGVYFDSSSLTLYIKTDSGIFPVLQKSSLLPEGTILLYLGSIAPTGWNAYDEETGMEGVIYITNGSSTSGGRTRVELYFIDNPDTTVEVGDTTYEFPLVGVRYRGSLTPYDGEWSSNEISYLSTNTTVANMINDSLNPRKYGVTTIRITLPLNEYHTDASITYQLQVNRKQISGLRFLVPSMTIQEGTSHNFKVDLTGIDSNLIDNEVIFKDNNTNVTYSMPAMLSAGTYYIKALLPLNDYHTSCDGGILSLTVESVLLSISPTVSLTGWTYGNAPYNPLVTGNLGNGTVTYSYKLSTADDSTYTSTKPSNAGTYTVRALIAETASYASGVCTSTFTISKANINPTVTMIGWTEGSTASNPSITGNLGNGAVTYSYKLSTAADSSYITTKPSSVGTYIIRAQIAETTNYNSGVCTASFSIVDRTKLNINPIVSISNWTYGETASNPSISGNTGNGSVSYSYKLSTASDNEYTSTKPSDAGTYIIRAVISETSDYNGATVTSSFTIGKANISPTVTMANWTYGTVASNPSVTGNTGGGQITYSYRLDTESNYYGTKPTNAGSYIVRAQIAATSNYNSGTATASFTINKAYRSAFVVEMDGWKYGETSHNPSVSGNLENGIVTYEYKILGGTYSSNLPESTSTPGTYYVKATAAPTANYYLATAENTFIISKADGSVTISGISLSYTGSALSLVTVSNNTGTMHYRLGTNGSWTTTPPSASALGNYTIYYYMDASAIYEGIGSSSNPRSVTSSISSSSPSYTAPTAKTGLTYNGNSQQLLNAGSTNDGTIYYSSDGSNWSTNIPTATNASDSITVYWKLIGDSNHSDVSSQSITCSIGKVQATYTTNPTANSNLIYDGTAKPLLSDGGTTSDGTIQYSIDNTNWSSNIPTATNAGEYTVYWKIVPDSNHIAVTGNATITIGLEVISMSVSVLENQVNEQSQGTDNSKSKVVIDNKSSYHINGIKFHIAQNGVWSDANDVTLSTTCDPNTLVELETTNLDGKTPYNEEWATNYNVSILTSDLDANLEYYVRIEALTNVQSYANGRCYTFTVTDQGVTFANSENSGTINTPSDSKIAINVKNNTNNNIIVNKVEFKVSDNGNTVSTDKLSISSSAITVNSNSTSNNYEITIPSNCRGNKSFANVANIILYDSNNDSVISIQATGTFKMGALYTINYGTSSSPVNESDDDIASHVWNYDNYILDSAIDSYIVHNYNMGKETHNTTLGWENLTKGRREEIVNASVVTEFDPPYIYGDHYAKFDNYTLVTRDGYTYDSYVFSALTSSTYNSNNDDHYKLEGPLSCLNGDNNAQNYLEIARYVADNAARDPSFNINRGRRVRPLGGVDGVYRVGKTKNDEITAIGNKWNSLYNASLCAIVLEDSSLLDNSEVNGDAPTSYPSGHSALSWMLAMLTTLTKYIENDSTWGLSGCLNFISKLYRIGVYRTIERFHWNSDTMYGRLWATMMIPVINAISDLDSLYINIRGLVSGQIPSYNNYDLNFIDLLTQFRSIIPSISSTADSTWDYLYSMYNAAETVLSTQNHTFLSSSTYPEVYPQEGYSVKVNGVSETIKYRGNNTKYRRGTIELSNSINQHSIMLSWLMAMCLTELYCDKDSNKYTFDSDVINPNSPKYNPNYTYVYTNPDSNTQTQLFALAYELGGGREVNLYDEYKLEYDPTILRLAASLVYATERSKYSANTIRGLNGGHCLTFNIDFRGLNLEQSNKAVNSSIECESRNYRRDSNDGNYLDYFTVGYGISTYYIFNDAPGPYNISAEDLLDEISAPFKNKWKVGTSALISQHQDPSLFNLIKVNLTIINSSGQSIPISGEINLYFDTLDGSSGHESISCVIDESINWGDLSSYLSTPLGIGETKNCPNCILIPGKSGSAPWPHFYLNKNLHPEVVVYVSDNTYGHVSEYVTATTSGGVLTNGGNYTITIGGYNPL